MEMDSVDSAESGEKIHWQNITFSGVGTIDINRPPPTYPRFDNQLHWSGANFGQKMQRLRNFALHRH